MALLNLLIATLCVSLAGGQETEFKQVLDNYSFDHIEHKPAIAYDFHQTTVDLFQRLKLIPKVKDKIGAFNLATPLKTHQV